MRLIDADELKKNNPEEYIDGTRVYFQYEIDNAPTVEPFERIGAICNENCGVYRPQVEWIEFADFIARNVVSEDFSEDVDFYAEVRRMNRYDDYTDSFISDDIDQKSYMLGYLNGCQDMLKKFNELNSLQISIPYEQLNMRGKEE